jgi:protein ImuA
MIQFPGAAAHCADLRQLAERIRAVESRATANWNDGAGALRVATGWAEVDAALGGTENVAGDRPQGGLARGVIHEWFGLAEPETVSLRERPARSRPSGPWTPPLCILAHLAWQMIEETAARNDQAVILWIGRRSWPHARLLVHPGRQLLLERSIFIDPPHDEARLWALDLGLRSPAVAAVIADGSRLAMAASRRLHLAARGHGGLALLVRPPGELGELSAAESRWLVRRHGPKGKSPCWLVELVRSRSARSQPEGSQCWLVEWNSAQGSIVISSDVAARSGAAAGGPPSASRTVAERRTA